MSDPGAEDVVSVYATFGSEAEAERIGTAAIEERLAACINILGPCRSIYRWQGAVERSDEIAAIFKTSAARSSALVERIAALHSYDVPAIAIWPIGGSTVAYRSWILDQVS